MNDQPAQARRARRHAAPHPGFVAAVFVGLCLAGLAPVTPAVAAFLLFSAAIPLGIYVAAMTSRLRFLGARVAGVDIALFGGFAASFLMLASALVQATLAQSGLADHEPLARALHSLIFASGGPGYSAPIGLLYAGIAIPSLIMGLLPRWLCVLGIGLGVVGELSTLGLLVPGALFLVPLTRFAGFVFLIAAGFKLPASARGEP